MTRATATRSRCGTSTASVRATATCRGSRGVCTRVSAWTRVKRSATSARRAFRPGRTCTTSSSWPAGPPIRVARTWAPARRCRRVSTRRTAGYARRCGPSSSPLARPHPPSRRLAVGIDARDGRVAARGSDVTLALTALELARRVRSQAARTEIYTDAARDGSLAGPDVDGAHAIAALGLDVIASGGVASLDDLRRVRAAGLAGAIVGRALHEGRFTLREALACVAA